MPYSMDKAVYQYPSLGPSNVVVECMPAVTDPSVVKLHPMLRRLVDAVAPLRPKLTFIIIPNDRTLTHDSPAGVVHVFGGVEYLGYLTTGYSNHGTAIVFGNAGLADKRTGGGYPHTTDEAKAKRMFLAAYRPTPPSEVAAKLAGKSRAVCGEMRNERFATAQQHRSTFDLSMAKLFNSGSVSAELTAALVGAGISSNVISGRVEALNRYHEVLALLDAPTVCVMPVDGGYHVYDYNRQALDYYISDELPEALRAPVGLLKMVDVGTVIPNVGVRTHTNALYVALFNS